MNTVATPIVTSTTLSILLHGVVVAAVLTIYSLDNQSAAIGQGLNIELVSSVKVSDQTETDLSKKQKTKESPSAKKAEIDNQHKQVLANQAKLLTKHHLQSDIVALSTDEQVEHVENDAVSMVAKSTNASQQKHSILDLLHSRIGENKEYPYMARRQRREGISTVAFMLHPDGTIENTRLITSSQTVALDRAALSAVNAIEPFTPAKKYLDQARMFKVNVVFDLL